MATVDVTDGVDYVLDVRDEAAVQAAFADVVGTHGDSTRSSTAPVWPAAARCTSSTPTNGTG